MTLTAPERLAAASEALRKYLVETQSIVVTLDADGNQTTDPVRYDGSIPFPIGPVRTATSRIEVRGGNGQLHAWEDILLAAGETTVLQMRFI